MPNTTGLDFCKYFYTAFYIARQMSSGEVFSQLVNKLRLMGTPWTSIFYHTTSLSLFQTDSQKLAGASSLKCLTSVINLNVANYVKRFDQVIQYNLLTDTFHYRQVV